MRAHPHKVQEFSHSLFARAQEPQMPWDEGGGVDAIACAQVRLRKVDNLTADAPRDANLAIVTFDELLVPSHVV